MIHRILRRDAVFVALASAIGVMVALIVGQFALLRISERKLQDYTTELLRYASEIASVSIDTFRSVENSREPICSDANLNEMRYLLFRREQLYDIGRVHDGGLICTAGWGRFSGPFRLPSPQRRQANGDDLWANVESPMDRRLVVDMASHGSVIVFTSPTAFKSYERYDPNFSALVLTQDGRHIYRNFGDTVGLAERFRDGPPAYEIGPRLTASGCTEAVDVCVVTALSNVSILQYSPSTWLGIACMGGLAAGSLGMVAARRRRLFSSLPQQIRRAVADGRLDVVYQPLVRIQDRCMVGVEALARLTDEQGETIPPEIFIGIAENSGFIGSITRVVIRRVLADMRDRLTGSDDFYVGINISAADAVDPTLREYMNDETERMGIPRQRVVLELTERSTIDGERLVHGVKMFRNDGYGFFIDDLGTGYSSLAYLSKLPISGIKVDRMFTQAIGKEAICSTIVEKICAITEALGVEVVVEGIECQEQASYLRELHPNAIGQGCLFGKPIRADGL